MQLVSSSPTVPPSPLPSLSTNSYRHHRPRPHSPLPPTAPTSRPPPNPRPTHPAHPSPEHNPNRGLRRRKPGPQSPQPHLTPAPLNRPPNPPHLSLLSLT